jgi:hypothetical protein
MTEQNQNSISPFLVSNQLAVLDGAEKALCIKVIAAWFPDRLHSFFSPIVWSVRASANPPAKPNQSWFRNSLK